MDVYIVDIVPEKVCWPLGAGDHNLWVVMDVLYSRSRYSSKIHTIVLSNAAYVHFMKESKKSETLLSFLH